VSLWFGAWRPALLGLLLAGCVTRPPPPAPPAPITEAAGIAEAERLAWLSAHPDWSFSARVALRQPGGGGSARLDWQQHGAQYRIRLSAPLTRQSWQLSGDLRSGHGRIEGSDGSALDGADAQWLLLDSTGWDIPLRELPDWVRGISYGVGSVDAQDRPQQARHSGWDIVWQAWHPPTSVRPALPRRIEAVRSGGAADAPRIRLLIERWEFP